MATNSIKKSLIKNFNRISDYYVIHFMMNYFQGMEFFLNRPWQK